MTINLIKKYVPLLDEVYKKGLLTTDLAANMALVRESMNANEILIPKITTQGLADYSKSSGFVAGTANLTWETHTFTQDRGRSFMIDNVDNMETAGVAFGALAADFIANKVVPETDAYRFAQLYANAGNVATPAVLSDSTVQAAIDAAMESMDEDNVPEEGRILYVSPTIYKYLIQSESDKVTLVPGASPNKRFAFYDTTKIVKIPSTRFYSGITLYDGSTSGQEEGGYIKADTDLDAWAAATAYSLNDLIYESGNVYKCTTAGTSGASEPTWPASGTVADGAGALVWTFLRKAGRAINFLLVHPTAVLPITKINQPRVFEPSINQDADAYKFQLRLYHDCFVFENKVDGIYAHIATA